MSYYISPEQQNPDVSRGLFLDRNMKNQTGSLTVLVTHL
jgi:hypothetical protein